MEKYNIKFWIVAILVLALVRYLWYLQDNNYLNTFLESHYKYIITKKLPKEQYNKDLYSYECKDFDGNSATLNITNRLLYNSILKGDTIEKIKGDSLITIKNKHLVLNFPFHGIDYSVPDTVIVR